MMIALVAAAYLLGSIPTGYWLGRSVHGIDIRTTGSGNVGATNVFRTLGPKAGLITLTVDIAKGILPVFAAHHFFPAVPGAAIGAGLAAILGHCTSPWLRFQGGKGVATSAGVFLALLPLPSVIAIGVFVFFLAILRYVSLASLAGAAALFLSSFLFPATGALRATAGVIALLVLWKHRGNIRRLLQGTEPRIDMTKAKSAPSL